MTTRRRASIAAALLAATVVGLAGCSGGGHQSAPHTTTTLRGTTPDPATTSGPSTTSPAVTTSTTVLGPSGPPADYPAAQPTPPSLAGAYPQGTSVNLVTVLKALVTYRDWVWSHPNPALVTNYGLPNGNGYAAEVNDIAKFRHEGLHADPTPSEITFVRVTVQAVPQSAIGGKQAKLDGYQWFHGGAVTAVYNVIPVPMLRSNGQPSGQQFNPPVLGQVAYSITLVQGPDGQFRFEDTVQLNPPGGIAALEQHQ